MVTDRLWYTTIQLFIQRRYYKYYQQHTHYKQTKMNRESPITTPREIPVSELVPHWLSEVNLSYAIPNFEMAGITTPRSFAELPLSYYEPLGVTKAEDRKNLFYLIQHVKKEIVSGEIAIREEKERKLLEEGNVNNGGNGGDGQIKSGGDTGYKQDEFHSPSNSKSRVNDYINGVVGDSSKSIATTNNDGDMMSTVHYNNQEPISPVTISSPIASVVGEDNLGRQRVAGRGAVKKKLALGGVKEVGTLNTGIITSSNKEESASTVKLTPREQLEKELEQRRLKRQQQKMAEKEQDAASINYQEEKKEKKSKRRQSFLPSMGGGGSVSSSRRSSIASSYRPPAVNKKNGDDFDELGSLLDDSEEKKCSSDLEDDYTASKSTATPRTVASVDVRSMRRSSIHHRQTIKKTNATKVGGGSRAKNRRYSSIPRATAPLLDDDDDGSILSDTSDLSASVTSYRSLGSSAR